MVMDSLENVVALRQREAEEMFAASLFTDPSRTKDACGWLDPRIIRDERIRAYWSGILSGLDTTDAALKAGILTDVMRWATPEAYIDFQAGRPFAAKIADEHWMFNLTGMLPDLARAIGAGNVETARKTAQELSATVPEAGENIPTSSDVGYEFVSSLDDEENTIPTFIPKLDNALGGLWRQTEIIICARPSVGKTALAWQIARNVAISGSKVLFISLEMSKRNLWARAACGAVRIPYRDVLAKRITERQRENLIQKNNEIIDALEDRLWIDDRTNQTTSDVWRKVASIRPDVLVVDHIRLFADQADKEHKRLGVITWNLKQIAKEYNCAVIPLAQLNRNLEHRTDKRPSLSDLRDSGEIEENADFVLGLHREREYLERQMEHSPADLIVLKFRDGPADLLVKLMFDGLAQEFGGRDDVSLNP